MSFELKYNRKSLKIAVLGSGVGGSSCSFFLNSLFHNNIEIDVFEKGNVVGGRVEYPGLNYECGISALCPGDLYMDQLRQICGLCKTQPNRGKAITIVNTAGVVFETKKNILYTFVDLLSKLGVSDAMKLLKWLYRTLAHMDIMYKLQDRGYTFKKVDDLLHKANAHLFNISQHNIRSVLKKEKLGQKLTTELANAACLSQYNQDMSVNGYVGTISLTRLVCSNFLWSVKDGTCQISERLFKLCGANLFLNSKVTYIGPKEDSTKNVLRYEAVGVEHEKVYDYIVIAFPLTKNNDVKIDFSFDHHLECDMKVTTCYFVNSNRRVPNSTVISCDPSSDVRSIEEISETTAGRFLYKVIASNADALQSYFTNFEIVKQAEWQIFPDYKKIEDTIQTDKKVQRHQKRPGEKRATPQRSEAPLPEAETERPALFPSILIDSQERSSVFYLNSIDWLASSNEMSCISARNIALLISDKEQSKEMTLNRNKIFATSKRDYYGDACGILSALTIFAFAFAVWYK